MSMTSPTLIPFRLFVSSTLRVTVRPSDVVTVTDGAAVSMAFTVTVRLSCTASVAAGSLLLARVSAESVACLGRRGIARAF